VKNPKTKYAMLEAKVNADFKLNDTAALKRSKEIINEYFEDSSLEELVNSHIYYLENDSANTNVQ
jgi:hypothetical protein